LLITDFGHGRGLHFLSIAVFHSQIGAERRVTALVFSKKLHGRHGSFVFLWLGYVFLGAWSCARHWRTRFLQHHCRVDR